MAMSEAVLDGMASPPMGYSDDEDPGGSPRQPPAARAAAQLAAAAEAAQQQHQQQQREREQGAAAAASAGGSGRRSSQDVRQSSSEPALLGMEGGSPRGEWHRERGHRRLLRCAMGPQRTQHAGGLPEAKELYHCFFNR